MLSYRHAFHAGNFADVLKHVVLSQVLLYMHKKEKGFSYIDTHAGAGMYSLHDPYAVKTGEYLAGIAKLVEATDIPSALEPYIDYVKSLNSGGELALYPGSPSIARHFLRQQDAAFLYDLHPKDHLLLSELFEKARKVQVFRRDGYGALKAHLPPATRRAVVLIDPPYELKSDYKNAVDAIINGHKVFNSGTFMLWYPVVQRHFIDEMARRFERSGIRNILQLELGVAPDSDEFGMTSSGLFVVNPPWTLAQQANDFLPFIAKRLEVEQPQYFVRQLVDE